MDSTGSQIFTATFDEVATELARAQEEIIATIGPALQNAIEEVLFNRSTPNAAALKAAEQVNTP